MQAILLAVVLAAAPVQEVSNPQQPDVVQRLQTDMQTGTLLFSRGDCLAVKIFTQSRYTHVAAVVVGNGGPYVYDSMNGVGVRRLPLAEYLVKERPDEIYVFQPAKPFSEKRARKFEQALKARLGTPYAITHHLTGQRCEGLHCSEYVTDALSSCNIIRAKSPPRVSPGSLAEGLLNAAAYTPSETVSLAEMEAAPPVTGNWCHRSWVRTKRCTMACCSQMRRWFFCK